MGTMNVSPVGGGGATAASSLTGRSRGSATPTAAGGSTFTIPHGLGSTPAYCSAQPKNALSAATYTVTADATNIIINYLLPPSAGALGFFWSAEL